MATAAEIGMLALRLPESDRAKLAADLLDSLPGILTENDDGLAEARRCSEEMDRDPSACLTHEEFLKALENYDKGDRGDPAKVVMNGLRERARKLRSEG
jgi:hypothetical protein